MPVVFLYAFTEWRDSGSGVSVQWHFPIFAQSTESDKLFLMHKLAFNTTLIYVFQADLMIYWSLQNHFTCS